MSHNTHARANENKLEKDGPTFSSCGGDFGRLFLATLIDNIFTNNTTVSSKNGLIISDISDHLPIFSIVFGDYLRKDSNSFTIRDTSEIGVNEFRHKLENTNWDFLYKNKLFNLRRVAKRLYFENQIEINKT